MNVGQTGDIFTPIRVQRVYAQVVEQMIDLIKRGVFPAGAQLPPERDLARQLGISRASLREALTVLQMQGWIEARSGQGTFVHDDLAKLPGIEDPARIYQDESPFSILQARMVLEPQVAALAARQRSDPALRRLEQILDWVKQDHSALQVFGEVYSEGDRKFHLSVAMATENPTLISMQSLIHQLMGQKLWLTLMRESSFATPGRWQMGAEEHWQIYEAIKNRAPGQARHAMRAHLEQVERIMANADLPSRPAVAVEPEL